jgi:thymidylate synthase (FAD)
MGVKISNPHYIIEIPGYEVYKDYILNHSDKYDILNIENNVEDPNIVLDKCVKNLYFTEQAKTIEKALRTAYKSEDKITDDSWQKIIKHVLNTGDIDDPRHESPIEFGELIVKFYTTRSVTHELVRHRIANYLQESTRYVNYSKDKFNNNIEVMTTAYEKFNDSDSEEYKIWKNAIDVCNDAYIKLTKLKVPPQFARSILPTDTKTEIYIKTNFRSWRNIFKMRVLNSRAHPDIRKLIYPLYKEMKEYLPEIFDMGVVKDLV